MVRQRMKGTHHGNSRFPLLPLASRILTIPRIYTGGFGWDPVFANDEIIFLQMNGLMLGTWLQSRWRQIYRAALLARPGAFALAHNVPGEEDVQTVIDRLAASGGHVLRNADAPPHGGVRGYVGGPRRPRMGDRVEPGMGDRRSGIGDFRSLGVSLSIGRMRDVQHPAEGASFRP